VRLPALLSRIIWLRNLRTAWIGCVAGLLLTVTTGVLLIWGGGGAFARLSYDFPFTWQRSIPSELVMVYIDAGVKRNLQQPTGPPLDRRFHAQLLNRLRDAGAKLVLYDLLLDEPSADDQADKEFAAAIRANGRVVLVADIIKQLQSNASTEEVLPPIPVLSEAAAGVGLARIAPDPGSATRGATNAESTSRYIRRLDPGTDSYPSASWVAASLLGAPVTKEPAGRLEMRWINYYCAPYEFRAASFDSALSPDELTSKYFRDKIVVVGVADNPEDTFHTPHSRFGSGLVFNGPTASGAAIHAMSLLNLIRGDWLIRLSARAELTIIIA